MREIGPFVPDDEPDGRRLLAVLGGRGPRPQERHARPAHARGPGPVPPPRRDRRRRRRELPARARSSAGTSRPADLDPRLVTVRISTFGQDGPYSAAARARPGRHRLRRAAPPHRLPRPAAGARRRHDLGLPDRRVRRAGRDRRALRARRAAVRQGRGDRRRALRRGAAGPRVDDRRLRPARRRPQPRGQPARELARRSTTTPPPTASTSASSPARDANFARLCKAMDRARPARRPALRPARRPRRARRRDQRHRRRLDRGAHRGRDRSRVRRVRRPGRHRVHRRRHVRRPPLRGARRPRDASTTRSPGRCASRRRSRASSASRRPRPAGAPRLGEHTARCSATARARRRRARRARDRRSDRDDDARRARPVHDGLFADSTTGRSACSAAARRRCGRHHFPCTSTCPYCGADRRRGRRALDHGHALGLDGGDRARRPATTARCRSGSASSSCPKGMRVITRLDGAGSDAARVRAADDAAVVADCTTDDDERRRRPTGRSRRERDRASRSPGSASTRSAGSRTATVTDMGVTAVRGARSTEAGVGPRRRSRPRSAAPRTRASPPATRCSARSALTGMPIVDVEAGCASGGAALQLAAGAIRAGQYDCVLVFGMEKMPKGIIRSSLLRAVARGGRPRGDARVLRAAGAAADARVRASRRSTSPRSS